MPRPNYPSEISDLIGVNSAGATGGGGAIGLPEQGMGIPISMTNASSFTAGIGPVIGGIAGLGGALINAGATKEINEQNIAYAREATGTNQAFAREMAAWQERLSNSAVQRSTQDMMAAGINPIMAVNPGGGASTPSGMNASVQTPDLTAPDYGSALTKSLASAMDVMRFEKDLEAQDANIKLAEASKAVKETEEKLNETTAKNVEQNTKINRIKEGAIKKESEYDEKKADYEKKFVPWDSWSKRVFETIGNTGGAIRDFAKGLSGTPGKGPSAPTGKPGNRNYGQGYKDGYLKGKGK